ncbi:MFS transporter [Streptomyces griseus]|uniref:MFS transporter n=1 Tax=Streptomyces stephensoniae TaxID=3375367 RepID=A0ABU2WCQ6_9ACTN|nr:MFS transporter [Streptomyces griseus]MDT0495630.1 MFS transporter [Streptomyces griseus]
MTAPPVQLPATAAASGRRTGLILAACCVSQFMTVLDASVVNVALPVIAEELGFSRDGLQWVNSAYTIAVCGFLLLGGRLADLYGQRRMFLCGIALFTAASAVGGLADDPGLLIAARAFQGLGAAVMTPATLAVLGTTFTRPAERARAYGAWGAASGAAGAVGVLVGGVIAQWFSWRWSLLINVPIGLALLAAVRWVVPAAPGRDRVRLDVAGAATVTLGLMALVYGIAESPAYGWGDPRIAGSLIASAMLLGTFLALQARPGRQPLVPLGIFRNRTVSAANLVAFFSIAALFSTFYFLTLMLQQVLGYSPLRTGLSYLPLSLGIAAGGFGIAPHLPRTGPRPVLLGGLSMAACGLLWLSAAGPDATFAADLLGPTLLLGLGMGAVINATTNAATHGLPAHQAGLASGLLNTTRQLGSALGLVVLATVAGSRISHGLASGEGTVDAYSAGYGLALSTAALFTAAALPAALAVPVRRGSRPSRGTGHKLSA